MNGRDGKGEITSVLDTLLPALICRRLGYRTKVHDDKQLIKIGKGLGAQVERRKEERKEEEKKEKDEKKKERKLS